MLYTIPSGLAKLPSAHWCSSQPGKERIGAVQVTSARRRGGPEVRGVGEPVLRRPLDVALGSPAILAQMVSVSSAPAGTAGMVAAARGRNSSAQYTSTAGPMLARVSRHLALC